MKPLKAIASAAREVLMVWPIRFYQKFISPLKPPVCRFYPTCSAYAIQAIKRFGMLGGGLMAVCRILRCNPLCKAGFDPVPAHFSLRPFAGILDPMPEPPAPDDDSAATNNLEE